MSPLLFCTAWYGVFYLLTSAWSLKRSIQIYRSLQLQSVTVVYLFICLFIYRDKVSRFNPVLRSQPRVCAPRLPLCRISIFLLRHSTPFANMADRFFSFLLLSFPYRNLPISWWWGRVWNGGGSKSVSHTFRSRAKRIDPQIARWLDHSKCALQESEMCSPEGFDGRFVLHNVLSQACVWKQVNPSECEERLCYITPYRTLTPESYFCCRVSGFSWNFSFHATLSWAALGIWHGFNLLRAPHRINTLF